MHIEARLTTTGGKHHTISWNSNTVRDLSVTVLHTEAHCLAHRNCMNHSHLTVGVVSSCLEALCVSTVMTETSLLAHGGCQSVNWCDERLGVIIHLELALVPKLRQLLVPAMTQFIVSKPLEWMNNPHSA